LGLSEELTAARSIPRCSAHAVASCLGRARA